MKVAIIGAGTIGRAIAESLAKARIGKIMVTRRRVEAVRDLEKLGIKVSSDNRVAASWADLVILCVKPKDVADVIRGILDEIRGKLVISVAAAVTLRLMKGLAPESRFIRAMPNIAVLVQEAFTAYAVGDDATGEDEKVAVRIFEIMGKHAKVEEKHMNAITALSGSTPAYVFTIIESLMYGGMKVGLDRELSLVSSAQALLGAAKLVLETGKHPVELKDMVVTPGGVTVEGIYALEDSRIRTAIMRAVEGATEKCGRISKEIEANNRLDDWNV